MTTLTASDAREHFADLLEKARHTGERTIITRRGRKLAAVVPVEDLELLEELEDRVDLAAVRAGSRVRFDIWTFAICGFWKSCHWSVVRSPL